MGIGPGLGAMTYGLLKAGHPVKAFEIDPAYADILENWYRETEIFEVVRGDVCGHGRSRCPPQVCRPSWVIFRITPLQLSSPI
jgi:16S rRNA A1518/A1519 N6-dimethyltransferase RsmA/KsgA/DIM1 with predicted DNA glycosylase/AP lyase activity